MSKVVVKTIDLQTERCKNHYECFNGAFVDGFEENKIPFIIGDLKEGIVLFDRKKINIMTSNTAVVGSGDDAINAFEDDCTVFRGIEREDVEVRDEKEFENCYISVEEVAQ